MQLVWSIKNKFMLKYFYISISFILIASCSNDDDAIRTFVSSYQDEDFTTFTNSYVHIRGRDSNGDLIIFAGSDIEGECKSPLVITIDEGTKEIISTNNHLNLNEGNCKADEEKMNKLALEFLEYKVGFIHVDKNNNAFFILNGEDRPNLVRFSNIKYKTSDFKDWRSIGKNWYQSIK